MASGFKGAAVVVGSISSLAESLKLCIRGLEKARLTTRTRRLRLRLKDRSAALTTQRSRLLNNLIFVLQAVDVPDQIDSQLDNVLTSGHLPAIFEDQRICKQLDELLGDDYRSFQQTIGRVHGTLRTINETPAVQELKVRNPVFGIVPDMILHPEGSITVMIGTQHSWAETMFSLLLLQDLR